MAAMVGFATPASAAPLEPGTTTTESRTSAGGFDLSLEPPLPLTGGGVIVEIGGMKGSTGLSADLVLMEDCRASVSLQDITANLSVTEIIPLLPPGVIPPPIGLPPFGQWSSSSRAAPGAGEDFPVPGLVIDHDLTAVATLTNTTTGVVMTYQVDLGPLAYDESTGRSSTSPKSLDLLVLDTPYEAGDYTLTLELPWMNGDVNEPAVIVLPDDESWTTTIKGTSTLPPLEWEFSTGLLKGCVTPEPPVTTPPSCKAPGVHGTVALPNTEGIIYAESWRRGVVTVTATVADGYRMTPADARTEWVYDLTAIPASECKPDKPEGPDRPDKPERPDRPDKPEGPDRPDRPEGSDRPDRPERPDHSDKPRPERPEGPKSPDGPQAPEGDGLPNTGADSAMAWLATALLLLGAGGTLIGIKHRMQS